MSERERISEVLDAIENGMCKIAETRDIWQNNLLYALCEGERILLTARLKELSRKEKIVDVRRIRSNIDLCEKCISEFDKFMTKGGSSDEK